MGGGPWLVKDNSEFIDYAEEKFNDSFALKRHPRTAVGATSDGKLLMVTVDGRQAISRGATLPEMSAIMRRLGAVNAINLDGGGSTAMSVRGIVVNSPSEGIQRLVANALLVFSNFQPADELPGLSISGINGDVIAGQGLQLSLTYGTDCPRTLTQEQMDLVIWGTTCGAGFVNQKGYYVPYSKPRKGTVNAIYGKSMASLAVNIIEPAPPAVQETQPASVPNSQPASAP